MSIFFDEKLERAARGVMHAMGWAYTGEGYLLNSSSPRAQVAVTIARASLLAAGHNLGGIYAYDPQADAELMRAADTRGAHAKAAA